MPVGYPPSVFVSSTCYDLSQIRRDLKRFVEGLGYEAIVSEAATFPVPPKARTEEACIKAVRDRADLLVLIVGSRYGTITTTGRSITNLEYLEARVKGIPIYVFVASPVLHALPLWKANSEADFSAAVDTPKLFQFVEDLRGAAGHWVYSFNEVRDIEEILRKQWAILFTDALTARNRLIGTKLPLELMTLPSAGLRLVLERPKGWEYRLFSVALRAGLEEAGSLRRDLQYGVKIGPVIQLGDVSEVMDWLVRHIERMEQLIDTCTKFANVALQEALGPPGQPGDAALLVYVGRRLAEVVRQLIIWTADCVIVQADAEFDLILKLTSESSKDTIQKLSTYPDAIDAEMDKAEAAIAKGEQYIGELILKLEWRETEEFKAEIDRLKKRYGAAER